MNHCKIVSVDVADSGRWQVYDSIVASDCPTWWLVNKLIFLFASNHMGFIQHHSRSLQKCYWNYSGFLSRTTSVYPARSPIERVPVPLLNQLDSTPLGSKSIELSRIFFGFRRRLGFGTQHFWFWWHFLRFLFSWPWRTQSACEAVRSFTIVNTFQHYYFPLFTLTIRFHSASEFNEYSTPSLWPELVCPLDEFLISKKQQIIAVEKRVYMIHQSNHSRHPSSFSRWFH